MKEIIIIISCLVFIVLIVTIGLCKASAAAYRHEESLLCDPLEMDKKQVDDLDL